jgi:membrane-bound metal-dependent hydrolase YbcI (DUF457 family)
MVNRRIIQTLALLRDASGRPDAWWLQHIYSSGAVLIALLTTSWHRRWEDSREGTPRRGLLDGLCHFGTALAVILPVLPYVRDRAGFLRIALLSAVAFDLDHIPAARSISLERCSTMPNRPASHSLLSPLVLALLVERWRPEKHFGLGVLLGLTSHLLRDLGTGGAPLVHPRRIITIPYGMVVFLLGLLSVSSRYATRMAVGGPLLAKRFGRWLLSR